MALGHKDSRRAGRRAFQPTLDGTLETRVLLSTTQIRAQTAAGGGAVVITSTTGQQFYVSVTQGTIKATPASGGRVNLVAKGTTSSTYLEINQIIPTHGKDSAHTFNPTPGNATGILNVASIDIVSGFIDSIEGYRDSVLSGPITVAGTSAVNRIAFTAINAGGSIAVGGDLDTLDVLNSATFSGTGNNLSVGQDLNWIETGQNLTIENGANFTTGRDLGNLFQVAKGSGNSGQGLNVNGNLTIGSGSSITIGRNIPFGVVVNGNLSGYSNWTVGGEPLTTFLFVTRPSEGLSSNLLVNGTASA
jgi:hypothetical protein